MKMVSFALIALFGISSFILGYFDHKILAGISAYLAVTIIMLMVWHNHSRNLKSFENRYGLGEAHGCYEPDRED